MTYRLFRSIGNDPNEAKPNVTWDLVLRVLRYARPYRKQIITVLLLILATTGLGLLRPLIFGALIDNALQPPGDVQLLNLLAVGLVTIPIITGVLRVVQRKFNASIGEGVIYDLRVSLFGHLQRMSLRFFTNTRAGELLSRMNNDVVGAQDAISNTIVNLVTNIITVFATLAVMFTLEWRLTIVGLLIFPLFVWAAQRIGNQIREISRRQLEDSAQMNALLNETLNISGVLLVKLFGRGKDANDRLQERAADVRDSGVKRAVVGTQFFVLISLIGVIGTALVYWVGGHLVLSGEFTIGMIVTFSTYLTQLYTPLQGLTTAPVDFATSMVSFERVFEVIDLPLEIDEKPDAVRLKQAKGELIFENVSFAYNVEDVPTLSQVKRRASARTVAALSGEIADDANSASPKSQARELALQDISFEIESGQLVALVGPSGAGKTTMTYLIPRLYDPTEGNIYLDGHNLRDLTLDSLSDNIGMVTQETYLFNDTILTNLLYARPEATMEEVIEATKAANIHDFIEGLSKGYNTVAGERGYRLSGGEKQRIAIARVILKNPQILVLDEATSNLDSQSEALIQDALAKLQTGRTSIVIAHRLSTILAADRILVMDRGQIVEQGTHSELLEQGGLYTSLYTTQFNHELEATAGD